MLLLPNTALGNQRQQAPDSLLTVWSNQNHFLILSILSIFILDGFSYVALNTLSNVASSS